MIQARFACGHVLSLSGTEQHPRCECGNDRILSVAAPPPRFTGHALGPCAKYEDLPAKSVTLKE